MGFPCWYHLATCLSSLGGRKAVSSCREGEGTTWMLISVGSGLSCSPVLLHSPDVVGGTSFLRVDRVLPGPLFADRTELEMLVLDYFLLLGGVGGSMGCPVLYCCSSPGVYNHLSILLITFRTSFGYILHYFQAS